MQKNLVLKQIFFGYVELHGFHGNPLHNFKERGCTYKNTHISAAIHPRTLNLVSN